MANANPRIGFIGVGLMGHGIAKNLVTKGFPLTIRAHRNRGRVHLHAASRRLVGLRDDVHDFVLARDGVERRNRELRSAEEDDPQSGAMLSRGRRGAWSFSFFVCGTFGPSTPLFGCGAGPGNP